MSVIDSRRYGRRSTTSFTRAEFEQIRNTPPADHKELRAESMRIMERIINSREQNNVATQQ